METPKSPQNKLFHDSPEDALTTDVLAAGGYKKVGHHIRKDLTPEQAAAWLRACLNVERLEKLGPGHVMEIKRLAKSVDSYATITYESSALGFDVVWLTPQDELNERLRKHNELSEELLRSGRELKEIITRNHSMLKAVR